MGDYIGGGSFYSTGYTTGTSIYTGSVIGAGTSGYTTISYTPPTPYEPEEEDERSDNEKWLDERIEEISVEL